MQVTLPGGETVPLSVSQVKFLRRLYLNGKPETVWPGTDTRVANNLARAGLISVVNDVATLTGKGRSALVALAAKVDGTAAEKGEGA